MGESVDSSIALVRVFLSFTTVYWCCVIPCVLVHIKKVDETLNKLPAGDNF